jgi:hypothetical protein
MTDAIYEQLPFGGVTFAKPTILGIIAPFSKTD